VLDQKEIKENLRTRFPDDRKPYTPDYDYDADSDLEDDQDWYSSDVEDSQVVPAEGEHDKSDSGTLVGRKTSDAKDNEPSDVISISDVDSLFFDSVDTKTETEVPVIPTPTHIGTVVVIDDVALVTWVCLSLSCRGLSNHGRQIPGATSLLIHERNRICAMGIRRETEGTRSRGNRRIVRNPEALAEIHIPASGQGCDGSRCCNVLELTSLPVRHPRTEEARVTTD